jgi:DNA-binding NtrC family response regulator
MRPFLRITVWHIKFMDSKILIVDDDRSIRKGLSIALGDRYCVITAKNGVEALELFPNEKPDIVLLDIGLPEIDGIEVLKRLKGNSPEATVIMVTAVEDVKTVVNAIKYGAYDFLVKPIDSQELLLTIQHAFENRDLKNRIKTIQKPRVDKYNFDLIGINHKIKGIVEIAKKASKSPDTPILITGESGVGKGVLAKATHYNSCKIPGPFVTVNCGAIAKELVESELFGYERGAFTGARSDGREGRFEEAAGGTLFLDEIGAMPLSAQVKLLAVLEDRAFYRIGGSRQIKVSARIIAATNTELDKAIELGEFRRDLFFRLNVVRLDLPPLRQRQEDIILLTRHFINQYNHKFGKSFSEIAPEAQTFLMAYPWPGNVRELRNTIERIILIESGNILTQEHFRILETRNENKIEGLNPETVENELDYNEATKSLIREAMKTAGGNVSEAARLMNMPSHKLRYRIKKYGLASQLN